MLNFVNREINHFKLLSKQARQLVVSYAFYSFAYPIFITFINAYIWKNNSQTVYLLYYRLGHFLVIPFVFLVNGLLLRKYRINWLYFLGSLLLAMSVILIIFFQSKTIIDYLIVGAIFGSGIGFFWANRNYITLKSTIDKNRNYFYGLNFSINIIFSLVVSFLVGWLIVFGLPYAFLMMLAFFILLFSGLVVLKTDYHSPKIKKVFISRLTRTWLVKRLTIFGIGIFEGLGFFIPSILILKFLGNEGILGTLTAVASLISASMLYIFARKSNKTNNKPFFIAAVFLGLITTGLLALFFNKITLLIYVLTNSLVASFVWSTFAPVLLNSIDREVIGQEDMRYSFVTDNEFFLNTGRFLSALVCLLLILFVNESFSLRFTPIILYLGALSIFIPLSFKDAP